LNGVGSPNFRCLIGLPSYRSGFSKRLSTYPHVRVGPYFCGNILLVELKILSNLASIFSNPCISRRAC
jgi:hypothetical protein